MYEVFSCDAVYRVTYPYHFSVILQDCLLFTNDFDSATHAKHISQSRLQYPTTATTVHGAGNYFDCTPRLTTHLTKHIVLYI